MNQQPGPRERILIAAVELFYYQGYANTSIEQVINQAGAYKKSFYRYFESREVLAQAYLQVQADFLLGHLDSMMNRYTHFEKFIKTWMCILYRDVKNQKFIGCPFAAFASDILINNPKSVTLQKELTSIVNQRQQKIADYLRHCYYQGSYLPADIDHEIIADRIILVYQGAIALYAISRSDACIRRLEKDILWVLQSFLKS